MTVKNKELLQMLAIAELMLTKVMTMKPRPTLTRR